VYSLIAERVYRPASRLVRVATVIRDLDHVRDADVCDAIIAGLPDWFGDEQGIADCAAAVRSHDGLVSEDAGTVAAFLTWQTVADGAAEITWMAVRAGARRRGHGRLLMEQLAVRLRSAGVRVLHVKTLSSRESYTPYAETRAFYRAMGFTEIEELDIWGEGNPAVLLSKRL
jgi:ribosomal protein S18 acetylase RimI-like enzyme